MLAEKKKNFYMGFNVLYMKNWSFFHLFLLLLLNEMKTRLGFEMGWFLNNLGDITRERIKIKLL